MNNLEFLRQAKTAILSTSETFYNTQAVLISGCRSLDSEEDRMEEARSVQVNVSALAGNLLFTVVLAG